jgi:tight adherence protein B
VVGDAVTRPNPAALVDAIDEVAALARAGLEDSLVWEPVTGPLAGGSDVLMALASAPADEATRRRLVAAERLARTTGASRADLLSALSASLADHQALADAHTVALAGPRATAKVLVWLPVLGLLLGTAIGAEPVSAILGGGIASVAALVGAGLMGAGWAWTRALLAAAHPDDDGPLVSLRLLAAALEAGLTLPAALSAARHFGGGSVEWRIAVAGDRLARGMTWDAAWAGLANPDHPADGGTSGTGGLAGLRRRRSGGRARGGGGTGARAGMFRSGPGQATRQGWRSPRSRASGRSRPDDELLAACHRVLTLAWTRGVAASPLLAGLAVRWRRRIQRDAAVAAAKLGVKLMLPLGLCYLPGFVALGLVPVVVSLAGGLTILT